MRYYKRMGKIGEEERVLKEGLYRRIGEKVKKEGGDHESRVKAMEVFDAMYFSVPMAGMGFNWESDDSFIQGI